MNVLVFGGTGFFGPYTVQTLLEAGHNVTIATRGTTADNFGNAITRLCINRHDAPSIKDGLKNKHYDVVIDKLANSANDIKNLLDVVDCDKYILTSSACVYPELKFDIHEYEFDPFSEPVSFTKPTYSYEESKIQAERALWQNYADKCKCISVRLPYVVGPHDYTDRLKTYVLGMIHSMSAYFACREFSFITEQDAGKFLAFLVDKDITGAINAQSTGTISEADIINFVASNTKRVIQCQNVVDNSVYEQFSLNIDKAKKLMFNFTDINSYFWGLIENHILEYK